MYNNFETLHNHVVSRASTLVDVLMMRSELQPDQLVHTFLKDGETKEETLTYKQLDEKARLIGAHLQSLHLEGERVVLLYHSGLEFVTAFFGCLYAGVIAVPAYPPRRNKRSERITLIMKDAAAKAVLTTQLLQPDLEKQLFNQAGMEDALCIVTDGIDDSRGIAWNKPDINGETLAFLQYTSGSTGNPKGVMVTHNNLLYNGKDAHKILDFNEHSVVVTWLPVFHDMGLVKCILLPVYSGIPCCFMSSVSFFEKPIRWLQVISRYKGTHSAAPNMAYALCATKITDEEKQQLNLRSWRSALNGSEPVRADTIDLFNKAFEITGLNPAAMNPCFGLAEATLKVTSHSAADGFRYFDTDIEALELNRIEPAKPDKVFRRLISSGYTILDTKVVVADPDSLELCAKDRVGEIWVGGPTVTKGYWNKPLETAHTFQAFLKDSGEGPFMRTGDLGFIKDEQLYITGRLKDVIIIHGSNHYPQDIEYTVANASHVFRPDSGAAFSHELNGEEKLVVVQEVTRTAIINLDVEEAIRNIRDAILEEHNLSVYGIVLIKTGSLLKTSSGKVQRTACKKAYQEGTLALIAKWEAIPEDLKPSGKNNFLERFNASHVKEERQQLILQEVSKILAEVMRIKINNLDVKQSFATLGLDSLMAVELKNSIRQQTGIDINITRFLDGINLVELCDGLYEELEEQSQQSVADKGLTDITPEMALTMLENIDDYSEEEVDLLLNKMLSKQQS